MRLRWFLFLCAAVMASSNNLNAKETVVWIGMERPAIGEREGIYRAVLDDAYRRTHNAKVGGGNRCAGIPGAAARWQAVVCGLSAEGWQAGGGGV